MFQITLRSDKSALSLGLNPEAGERSPLSSLLKLLFPLKMFSWLGRFRGFYGAGRTQGAIMPATGELIRLMNYVDDIAAILRRINAALPAMTAEEHVRLADYIRKSEPSLASILSQLDKGAK
jgi:hypothetical protein